MSTLVQESWGEPPRDLKPGARLGAELVVTRVLGYDRTVPLDDDTLVWKA